MLHTVHKSPFEANDLESCLRVVSNQDDVLLYEDAVIAAVVGNDWTDKVAALIGSGVAVSALGPDLAARGIAVDKLIAGLRVVDYDAFVELVEGHDTTQAW